MPVKQTIMNTLTSNEKKLLADTLNGCGTLLLHDPHYLGLITAEGGLEAEATDACLLNALDEKWQVNGPALVTKLRALSRETRETLVRGIAAIWERNDEHFERDLEAIEA